MDESEPEPDLMAVRGTDDDYILRHPEAAEIGLVAEVAESTLSEDRNVKAPIYARAGIAVYWIVNLVNSRIEVCTDPTGPDASPHYRQQHIYGINDAVPLIIDGQTIAQLPVRDILP
jgi:Uma2 family endonuclease